MLFRRWLITGSVLVLAMLLEACGVSGEPEEGCNFVVNSLAQRVSWSSNLPVKIFIHSSVPQQHMGAISSALQTWDSSLGSRPIFELVGVINQGSQPVQDGASVIYWRDTWDDARRSEQARTTIFWKGTEIREADIQINARDFTFFSGPQVVGGAVDIESLMVHELGHALGLAHNDGTGSVMATHLASSTLRRQPTKLDVDSLRCEY